MGSYYRDGSDHMTCVECGDEFDVNDSERLTVHPGARFQPYCLRHLRQKLSDKYGDRSEVACVACGSINPIGEMGMVSHIHPNGEVDPVFVCSEKCTLSQLNGNAAWNWHGDDAEFGEDAARPEESKRAREVANRAVEYITSNYRCEAVLLPELVDMKTFEFTVRIDRDYGSANEQYVERFDRIAFETDYGRCTLELVDYAAFGICKFSFELPDSA